VTQPKKGKRLHLIVPPDDSRFAQLDGWGLFQIKQPPSASPLWVFVKAVHVARKDEKHSPTCGRRAYRLRWGVDKQRFAGPHRHFRFRFPAVVAHFEAACRSFYTVTKAEHNMRYLGIDPAGERARMAKSEAKGAERRARRAAAVHEAALAEDRQRTSGKSVREGEV
jgi:hypothetical protein